MCNACGFQCCASDEFEACGCDDCSEPRCGYRCEDCGSFGCEGFCEPPDPYDDGAYDEYDDLAYEPGEPSRLVYYTRLNRKHHRAMVKDGHRMHGYPPRPVKPYRRGEG